MTISIPGKPVPWKRAGSNGKRRYTNPKYKAWRDEIIRGARATKHPVFEQPVLIYVGVRGPNMLSDGDNHLKAVCDGLKIAGLIHDDCFKYVQDKRAYLLRDGPPRLEIEVRSAR